MTNGGMPRRTAIVRQRFLNILSQGGSVSSAARAAGIPRRSAYDWRNDDPDFRAAWEDAYDAGTDRYEDALRALAANGDVAATIFALKARRPQVYNRRMLTDEPDLPVPALTGPDSTRRRRIYIPAVAPEPGSEPPAAEPTEVELAETKPIYGSDPVDGAPMIEGEAEEAA